MSVKNKIAITVFFVFIYSSQAIPPQTTNQTEKFLAQFQAERLAKLNTLIEKCKKFDDNTCYKAMKKTGEEIKGLCYQIDLKKDGGKIEEIIKKYDEAIDCTLTYEKANTNKKYGNEYIAMSNAQMQLHDAIHQIKKELGLQARL